MILTKTSTKTDKSSFSQKRLISLSPHLIFRTTPFYFVTYSPFCNLIGLQYALQREQLALDQTLSARARGCGYARLLKAPLRSPPNLYPAPPHIPEASLSRSDDGQRRATRTHTRYSEFLSPQACHRNIPKLNGHVHTYAYHENRSLIQSLALIRSAIISIYRDSAAFIRLVPRPF